MNRVSKPDSGRRSPVFRFGLYLRGWLIERKALRVNQGRI
jgi:hypothetical protein